MKFEKPKTTDNEEQERKCSTCSSCGEQIDSSALLSEVKQSKPKTTEEEQEEEESDDEFLDSLGEDVDLNESQTIQLFQILEQVEERKLWR